MIADFAVDTPGECSCYSSDSLEPYIGRYSILFSLFQHMCGLKGERLPAIYFVNFVLSRDIERVRHQVIHADALFTRAMGTLNSISNSHEGGTESPSQETIASLEFLAICTGQIIFEAMIYVEKIKLSSATDERISRSKILEETIDRLLEDPSNFPEESARMIHHGLRRLAENEAVVEKNVDSPFAEIVLV